MLVSEILNLYFSIELLAIAAEEKAFIYPRNLLSNRSSELLNEFVGPIVEENTINYHNQTEKHH